MAVGMFILGGTMVGDRSKLVDNLLKEAKEGLKTRSRFHKSYDYDGMGTSFFKTSIDIEILDRKEDMYSIGIYAAYVGDKPEEGLAEHFSIPRTLLSCAVEIETKPIPNNRFEFDFEPVLRKLDTVLDTKKISGKKVAGVMMIKDDERIPSFILQVKDGLEVHIQPGRVGDRVSYLKGKAQDTWSSKGSVLFGELKRDYSSNDVNAKATPTLLIGVHSSTKDNFRSSLPIWQPDLQEKAIYLTEKIAKALQ
jgi:hypothetical protein